MEFRGRSEFGAVPKIRIEERIRDVKLVRAKVRVRDRASIEIRSEYRARNRRDHPLLILEARLREGFSTSHDQAGPLQPPRASGKTELLVGGRLLRRLRPRDWPSAPVHFDLAQDIAVLRSRPLHQHANIAALRRLR